jgi:hypothetical protein
MEPRDPEWYARRTEARRAGLIALVVVALALAVATEGLPASVALLAMILLVAAVIQWT